MQLFTTIATWIVLGAVASLALMGVFSIFGWDKPKVTWQSQQGAGPTAGSACTFKAGPKPGSQGIIKYVDGRPFCSEW